VSRFVSEQCLGTRAWLACVLCEFTFNQASVAYIIVNNFPKSGKYLDWVILLSKIVNHVLSGLVNEVVLYMI
jgi:hypothetical protein